MVTGHPTVFQFETILFAQKESFADMSDFQYMVLSAGLSADDTQNRRQSSSGRSWNYDDFQWLA